MFATIPRRTHVPAALALLCAAWAWSGPAHADDIRMPRAVPAAYTQECGACHVAYAPALLPAASWTRVMQGLDHHFGVDASLDAQTRAQLSTWLQAQGAGRAQRAAESASLRISEQAWFVRKHGGIEAATWRLPSVKSAAQCGACHAGAERGRFDDDDLRQPAGLSARQRRQWGD